MMNVFKRLGGCVLGWSVCLSVACAATPPNVLVIMADDLGYHDVGFQGAPTVKTPHIDALAQSGMIFTDAHSAASVCAPSRAGFMTARSPSRFGAEANMPPNGKGTDPNEYTMGNAFKSLGYNTYMVGKWHLGHGNGPFHPNHRGFDKYYNNWPGKGGKGFFPQAMELNGERVAVSGHRSDILAEQAMAWICESKDHPFFMFLAFYAPHTPLTPKKEDLASVGGKNKYYGLIHGLDRNVGRVIQTLKDEGLYENTIVWFLSDNGGTCAQASNRPLNGKKGLKFEGGQRVPFVLSWPGNPAIKAGSKYAKMTSSMDIFPTSYALAGGTAPLPNPIDGVNIYPNITGQTSNPPHTELYWRKLEGKAMRVGYWKLILSEGLPPMLYNLEDDLSERHNLAAQQPERVSVMAKKIERWETELKEPLWREAKKYIGIRKKDYIRFRDATDFISIH